MDGNFIAILVLLVFTAVVVFALIPVMSKFYVKTLKGFSEGRFLPRSTDSVMPSRPDGRVRSGCPG